MRPDGTIKLASTLTLVLFIAARGASADILTVTMFVENSAYPLGEVGLALCPTTQACHASLSNAIASFDFSPMPGGTSSLAIDTSNPAFGLIAGYLSMTDQQITQNGLSLEAIVPFYWNTGPVPPQGPFPASSFFTSSQPNLNYFIGHFDTGVCTIDGVLQDCGYPIAGREIDSLSLSVSPLGEMKWQVTGVNIGVPEPTALSWLFAALAIVFFSRLRPLPNR